MKAPETIETGSEGEGSTWRERAAARVTRAVADSAWAPIAGKAAAYLAGIALLALVGSGGLARWLSPSVRIGVPTAQAATAEASAKKPAPAPPAEVPAAPDAGADAAAPEVIAEADGGATASGIAPDGKVILNLATEDELRRLPGVGHTRAKAILALRARLGKFKRPEDLLRVKGIGRRSLARLRPLVRID